MVLRRMGVELLLTRVMKKDVRRLLVAHGIISAADAEHCAASGGAAAAVAAAAAAAAAGDGDDDALAGDATYRLLVACNALAVDIEADIAAAAAYARHHYAPKFPELASLVVHPVDYARVVSRLGDAPDPAAVDLEGILPQATVMVVVVTASTTAGAPLGAQAAARVQAAADLVLRLDAARAAIGELVQREMGRVAPNLSAAVGPAVSAQLMGVAGGLGPLSRLPASTVHALGTTATALAGRSAVAAGRRQGFVYASPIVQGCPPALRPKAAKLVGAKAALLARVDAYGSDPSGATGEAMRAAMVAKVEKWQEPPPAKTNAVLPAPDAAPKKRRGGRRARKEKERYGLTDMRAAANRAAFGVPEEEVYADDDVVGLGTLGGGGTGGGRLRLTARSQGVRLSAKQQKKYARRLGGGPGGGGGSGLATGGGPGPSGLASSLAFTPVQGIELGDPAAIAAAAAAAAAAGRAGAGGTASYFAEDSGFRSVVPGAG
jgi:U4/U6 small nuclear ribonucleoprotein PRP31